MSVSLWRQYKLELPIVYKVELRGSQLKRQVVRTNLRIYKSSMASELLSNGAAPNYSNITCSCYNKYYNLFDIRYII